jgi:hypothetical protein
MTEPVTAELQARQNMAEKLIADLRRHLLDLRNSNRLLNFKFSDRARTHVRIVDELPDVLYGNLIEDGVTNFLCLGYTRSRSTGRARGTCADRHGLVSVLSRAADAFRLTGGEARSTDEPSSTHE